MNRVSARVAYLDPVLKISSEPDLDQVFKIRSGPGSAQNKKSDPDQV